MPQLKPLSPDAVPAAFEKALRYRLLNEPTEAESICLDILDVEPENQEALVTLVLCLTDQLGRGRAGLVAEARRVVERLKDEYQRLYYTGIVLEREAKARHRRGGPGCGPAAYELLSQAMDWFSRAMASRPPGNEAAVLRWNACVRFMERNAEIQPAPVERVQPFLE